MIAERVANLLALDYPARARCEVIVACDGSPDATAARAPARPAPTSCSSCPRGGKVRAQDAGRRARAGRDRRVLGRQRAAGSRTRCGAGRRVRATPRSATSAATCGSSTSAATTRRASTGATRWRCARSSRRLRSVTGGNGAIYATRRESYLDVDPIMGHDLSFPFNMVKRGWRAVYAPRRARDREDGPDDRGRVRAQAADDEPRLADRAPRRDALAARL